MYPLRHISCDANTLRIFVGAYFLSNLLRSTTRKIHFTQFHEGSLMVTALLNFFALALQNHTVCNRPT